MCTLIYYDKLTRTVRELIFSSHVLRAEVTLGKVVTRADTEEDIYVIYPLGIKLAYVFLSCKVKAFKKIATMLTCLMNSLWALRMPLNIL